MFAAWEPPKLYANRYRWRASAPYKALVRDPQNTILSTLPPQTQSRYAEVGRSRAATAIQGSSAASTSKSAEPLVRNVDLWIFGDHKARR